MPSQGPVGSLWLWQTPLGTYSKRVRLGTPHASMGGCRTKCHRPSPHSSSAGQPSGLPCFLPRQGHSSLPPLAGSPIKGDPLCSAPVRPRPGNTSSLGSPTGERSMKQRGSAEARRIWGAGAASAWSRGRRRGTSQHTPVPTGKASRGWGQALPSTAWWEGERQWLLLKLQRFGLERSKENQNPCEERWALEWVAQGGCEIPEHGSFQELSGHDPEHNCHKPVKGCPLECRKSKHHQWET